MHPSEEGPGFPESCELPFLPAGTWPGCNFTPPRAASAPHPARPGEWGAGESDEGGMRGGGEREGPATCRGGGASEVCDKFQGLVKNPAPYAQQHPPPRVNPLINTTLGIGGVFKLHRKLKQGARMRRGRDVGPLKPFSAPLPNFPKCPPPAFPDALC